MCSFSSSCGARVTRVLSLTAFGKPWDFRVCELHAAELRTTFVVESVRAA